MFNIPRIFPLFFIIVITINIAYATMHQEPILNVTISKPTYLKNEPLGGTVSFEFKGPVSNESELFGKYNLSGGRFFVELVCRKFRQAEASQACRLMISN